MKKHTSRQFREDEKEAGSLLCGGAGNPRHLYTGSQYRAEKGRGREYEMILFFKRHMELENIFSIFFLVHFDYFDMDDLIFDTKSPKEEVKLTKGSSLGPIKAILNLSRILV